MIFATFTCTLFAIVTTIFIDRSFSLLFLFYGRIYLKFEREKFQIFWQCLGIKYRKQGATSAIQTITVTTKKLERETVFLPYEYCTLYEGIKEYKFGIWLTKAERRWLVTEIANFITEQYPDKNKEDWLRDIWKLD